MSVPESNVVAGPWVRPLWPLAPLLVLALLVWASGFVVGAIWDALR